VALALVRRLNCCDLRSVPTKHDAGSKPMHALLVTCIPMTINFPFSMF
jgi:hypothetical protein